MAPLTLNLKKSSKQQPDPQPTGGGGVRVVVDSPPVDGDAARQLDPNGEFFASATTTTGSSNAASLPHAGSLHSSNNRSKKYGGNILSKLSLGSRSLSIDEEDTTPPPQQQQQQYPHQQMLHKYNHSHSHSSANNNNGGGGAAFELQAALSKSLSIENNNNRDDYSENATTNQYSANNTTDNNTYNTNNSTNNKRKKLKLPNRYRGFSTSISSLFLDESIVCGAIGCCGVLLSSRTEYLLNERNIKRGVTRRGAGYGKEGAQRSPSSIVALSWIGTIVGILGTFVIFGFGDGTSGSGGGGEDYGDYYDGDWLYDDDEDQEEGDKGEGGDKVRALKKEEEEMMTTATTKTGNKKKKKHSFIGVMKLRDYREHVFDPTLRVTKRILDNVKSQWDDEEYTPGVVHHHGIHLPRHRNLNYDDDYQYNSTSGDIATFVRLGIILTFLFLLGFVGRRRRMRTRYTIQRARTQDDHIYYASVQGQQQQQLQMSRSGLSKSFSNVGGIGEDTNNTFHEREDKYDGACSHTLFGCYPVDNKEANYADFGDDEDEDGDADDMNENEDPYYNHPTNREKKRKKKRKGGDFVNRTMNKFFSCCCGILCKCWCQAFSICALAQEARETRLLVPPSMQRVDLITHQPFHEYARDVNNVRRRFMEKASRSWMQHYAALSRLSRYILFGFVAITGLVVFTMLLHPASWFTWGDALVLIATFTQSFLVLMIVFGIFHRSDLSFDAVVKFFAVGFCICVPVGIVVEGLLMNGLVSVVYLAYYLVSIILGANFDYWVQDHDDVFWFAGELVGAYLVAALVEELCKYYGFRFVEHPDLIFLTGLDRSAEQAKTAGGVNAYKFDSQLVSEFSRSLDMDGEDFNRQRTRSWTRTSKRSMGKILHDEDEYDEPDLRTVRQQAAAITTGMISTAVGLACAENFMYVFFLGGSKGNAGALMQELMILLFRSLFPVHALAAAMQSVNVIRKFIEEPQNHIGVGRIIFPAVMLHGTFDAILLAITTYIEKKYDQFYENGGDDENGLPFNPLLVNIVAWTSTISLMTIGYGWYLVQHRRQMRRLALIEAEIAQGGRSIGTRTMAGSFA